MNKLLEQLRTLPQFNSVEHSVKQKLTIDNGYVEHFAPDQDGYYEEKGDDGRQVCYPYHLSDEEVEENAIDDLLYDNSGYFDDFIHDELLSEVTELCRALIKEIRK